MMESLNEIKTVGTDVPVLLGYNVHGTIWVPMYKDCSMI